MPKNKIIIALGGLTALLPVLGFPHQWESILQVLIGLSIVLLSVLITVDKKITQKLKAKRRLERRNNPEYMTREESENLRRRMTDFYPKTGQPGRRATDIKWNDLGEEAE
jgi:hypothetical protein